MEDNIEINETEDNQETPETKRKSPKIIALSAADGWSAVFMSQGDLSCFSVPLVAWGLAEDWDEHDWIEEKGNNCMVGMVLGSMPYYITPAADATCFKTQELEYREGSAWFCGYLPRGMDINDFDWDPVWKEKLYYERKALLQERGAS